METLVKFRGELAVLEHKLTDFRASWEEHLRWVARQTKTIAKDHPTRLTPGTWAAQQTLSQALYRLSTIEQMLIARNEALEVRGITLDYTTLEDRILHVMHRSPVSSETLSWQLISAVAEAETGLEAECQRMHAGELHLIEHINDIARTFGDFSKAVKSENFARLCMIQNTIDEVEEKLLEFTDLGEEGLEELEDDLDSLRAIVNKAANPDAGFLCCKLFLSKLGIKVARQTLITEYFEASGAEVEEDTETDDGSEMEDVNAVENNTEMEGDIEMG